MGILLGFDFCLKGNSIQLGLFWVKLLHCFTDPELQDLSREFPRRSGYSVARPPQKLLAADPVTNKDAKPTGSACRRQGTAYKGTEASDFDDGFIVWFGIR